MTSKKEIKPIVFCNIGWNNLYVGDPDDPLIGGGSHVKETGGGNEELNFYPITAYAEDSNEGKNMFFGSFETKSNRGNRNQTHIEHIRGCGGLGKENYAEDVLVVWCAKNPQGKSCVVGWYNHATVSRYYDVIPVTDYDGYEWDRYYNVCCLYEDATLLPVNVRSEKQWEIPRHNSANRIEYGFGQANIWYASAPEADEFVERMIRQIENYSGEDIKCELG